MKIQINIPKEFEGHFKDDKFEDSLKRLIADAGCLAGLYEVEVGYMLIEALKNSVCINDILGGTE